MHKLDKIFEYFIKTSENSLFIINTKAQDKYLDLLSKDYKKCCIFDALNDKVKNPYFPFLNKIKQDSKDLSDVEKESMIEKSKVYYFQREIFKSFIYKKK